MSRHALSSALRLLGAARAPGGLGLGVARAGILGHNAVFRFQRSQKANVLSFPRFNSTTGASAVAAAPSSPSVASEISDVLPQISEISQDAAAETAKTACDHIGYLSDLGIVSSWWWPADFLARALEAAYVCTGLPWWATIGLVTVGIRLAMFPLYVKSSDATARMSHIKEDLDKLNEQGRIHAADPQASQKLVLQRAKLFRSQGIKMRYMAAPVVQIPFALGMFGALRKMANHPVDGFTSGGFAWFTDLAATDPYLGLQCITAAAFVGFMRIGGETGTQNFNPTVKKVLTVLPLISIPLTMNLSSGIVWYFAINAAFSICQTTLLKAKWFRKKFDMKDIAPPKKNADGTAKEQRGIMEMWEDAKRDADNKRKMKEYQDQVSANLKNVQSSNNRAYKKAAFRKTVTK